MKIGICDDDRTDILITQKELQNIVPKLCTAPEIYEFSDGSTMTEDILKTGIDVALLDIDMPDVNGLSVAIPFSHHYFSYESRRIGISESEVPAAPLCTKESYQRGIGRSNSDCGKEDCLRNACVFFY